MDSMPSTEAAQSDSDSELNDDLESEESHDKSSSESVTSILTQLRCPSPSRLARKRKIKMNSPPIGKKGEVDMLLQTPKV